MLRNLNTPCIFTRSSQMAYLREASVDDIQQNLLSSNSKSIEDQYANSQLFTLQDVPITEERHYSRFIPTMMNLVNTLTGAEILGVANSMTFGGLVVSVCLIVLAALLSYVSAVLILQLQHKVGSTSINELATHIVGRWAGDMFSILTLCFTYSCQVAYLVIAADLIQDWLKLIGYDFLFTGWFRPLSVLVYAMLVPVWMTFPRKNNLLGVASTMAYACQMLFIVSMIIKAFQILPEQGVSPTCEVALFDLSIFNSFSIYSLMFSLAPVMLPLISNFNPGLQQRYRLIGACFVTCFTIVVLPSVIGYILFGAESDQIILLSFSEKDGLIQAVRIAYIFIVNASYPVIGLTVLSDISGLMYREEDPSSLPTKKRAKALLVANVPPVLIAMFLPKVRPALEIGGAFGGCLSNFVFPPLLWMHFNKKRMNSCTSFLLVTFSLFGLFTSGLSTYEAVLDAIESMKEAGV